MTQPLNLAPIQARHETYAAIHSASGIYAHCAAQESAEDVPALTAEVTRLREENARLTAELTVEYNPVAAPKTIIQLAQHVEPEWRQFYEDESGGTVTICSHPEDGTVRIFTSYRACRVPLGVVEAVVAALREAAHRTTQHTAPAAALEG